MLENRRTVAFLNASGCFSLEYSVPTQNANPAQSLEMAVLEAWLEVARAAEGCLFLSPGQRLEFLLSAGPLSCFLAAVCTRRTGSC